MKSLAEMKIGESGVVDSINITGILRRRIIDMGLTKGSTVTIEKVAPLGDPIDVKVKDFHIAIRKSDAKNIIIK
ncbi:ferrous iron transport protein A [Acetoanaerobium pronyense]|uniref:Ferrous iron transport protein A n=1 Tax=Acetoanaerobium pronyense TaxID=1482736 RepID=A0ABS4KMA7_9FIRM|nr:FeoA family protein [Acetoanaerobium pronyense]MBP2028291.1 ferrous iron transport protein A [Acetoanaerobium pronyense]